MKRTFIAAMIILFMFFLAHASGEPSPIKPTTPDALGLQPPKVISFPVPSAQESSQGLINVDKQSTHENSQEANGLEFKQMIVPSGANAPNYLYAVSSPQTIVGCYIYAKLPLWMEIEDPGDPGNVWLYEWYQDGHLETDYVGQAYSPGWFKIWFFPNIPGWHTLQFYCNGWSNYVYIYVYSSGNADYWVSPPNQYSPTPLPYEPQLLGNNTAKSQPLAIS